MIVIESCDCRLWRGNRVDDDLKWIMWDFSSSFQELPWRFPTNKREVTKIEVKRGRMKGEKERERERIGWSNLMKARDNFIDSLDPSWDFQNKKGPRPRKGHRKRTGGWKRTEGKGESDERKEKQREREREDWTRDLIVISSVPSRVFSDNLRGFTEFNDLFMQILRAFVGTRNWIWWRYPSFMEIYPPHPSTHPLTHPLGSSLIDFTSAVFFVWPRFRFVCPWSFCRFFGWDWTWGLATFEPLWTRFGWVFTVLDRVEPNFYRVLPSFTWIDWVLSGFSGFFSVYQFL